MSTWEYYYSLRLLFYNWFSWKTWAGLLTALNSPASGVATYINLWFWLLALDNRPLQSAQIIAHRSPPVKGAVLVHLGCYSKIPQTGWVINNKNSFLTVLESESPRSGCQHIWVLVRIPFESADFLYPHMVEGARELSGASLIQH